MIRIATRSFWLALLFTLAFSVTSNAADEKPLFRDFMGINGHTIQFKPDLYAPAVRAVRDYHPLDWDTGNDTSFLPPFPSARNGVDWKKVYGDWKTGGYETEACIMFDNLATKSWKDLPKDANQYGRAFAKELGPSSSLNLVSAAEIGNEPGKYDDESYRNLFKNMAQGLREGDPKLKIGTCAITTGPSEQYAKSVKCVTGLENLYDFLNIHTYAELEGYPTWRRSYPEDPKLEYLRKVQQLIDWKNKNAPGKEVRITEFGWDASTKPAPKTGDFAKWVGSTETEQAQYLVRSFLLFSKLDVTRAYIFFFDDKDEPQIHGSSGLTRNGKPKPAFHAVAHLQKTLGNYRFRGVIEEKPGEVYIYEFAHGDDPTKRIWAVWSPTGSGKQGKIELKLQGMKVVSTTRTPLSAEAPPIEHPEVRDDTVIVNYGESPVFIELRH